MILTTSIISYVITMKKVKSNYQHHHHHHHYTLHHHHRHQSLHHHHHHHHHHHQMTKFISYNNINKKVFQLHMSTNNNNNINETLSNDILSSQQNRG